MFRVGCHERRKVGHSLFPETQILVLLRPGPWLLSGGPGTCLHAAIAGRYFPSACDQIETVKGPE